MPPKPDLSFTVLDEFVINSVAKNTKSCEEEPKIQVSNGLGPQKKLIFLPNVHGNPQIDLQDKGVIDSGCSRQMTGNMSYLTDYEEIDRGYVAFGGNPKGGKIIGKCTIKTGNLDFKNVYFMRELKFNLFSISQMCDKKNSVLFNDTECIVLSPNFKLIDESQVLLRVPRKNMYSVDLKNIVPKVGVTCLFAKATSDESKLLHRRLGHLNFKTMNKLVKGNLVRGLPSKLFDNNQNCVACHMGMQHRASCKSKIENSISLPLHLLHMDLFGLTFVKSLVKKMYCLVVTDDYSRIENLVDHKVKVIRCDNRIKFKNKEMNQFYEMKGKFNGKADEGFFVGYSLNSKAFRVFNIRTKIVEENLHIRFSENTPNVVGSGPDWLFDIDALTRTMNYEPIVAEKEDNVNSANNVNIVSSTVNVVVTNENNELLIDPNMPALEDVITFNFLSDDEDDNAVGNINNLDTTIQVSHVSTTRIHKDHTLDQVIENLQSAIQTRKMLKNLEEHRFTEVKNTSIPIKTQKPLLKDKDGKEVDVHMYRYQVNLKVSHLHAVKRIFRKSKEKWVSIGRRPDRTGQDRTGPRPSRSKTPDRGPDRNGTVRSRKPTRNVIEVPKPSDPMEHVTNEAIHKELGDSLVRAATTASSLEAEQDSGNIKMTQSKATPNESRSQETNSGGGPRLDEEATLKLQAKFDEEQRLAREKAKKELEANIVLIETWDDVQAKIDIDHQLAKRLRAEEKQELIDEEKAILFMQFLEKKRNFFAAKRVEEKRNKPPTQAQKIKIMCTYLKNME
nr:putative ribonuclease H-like domain-containing protein [Tanacetum cinerariifolium]